MKRQFTDKGYTTLYPPSGKTPKRVIAPVAGSDGGRRLSGMGDRDVKCYSLLESIWVTPVEIKNACPSVLLLGILSIKMKAPALRSFCISIFFVALSAIFFFKGKKQTNLAMT